MDKLKNLVTLLKDTDNKCSNTFCNTCQYSNIKDNGCSCWFYMYAQAILDAGYDKTVDVSPIAVFDYREECERLRQKLQIVLLTADIIKDFSKSISIHEAYKKGAKDALEKLKSFKTAYDNGGDGDLKLAIPFSALTELLEEFEND